MCDFLPFHSDFCCSSGQTFSKKIHFRCRLDRKKVAKFLHDTLSWMKTMEDCRSIFSIFINDSLYFHRFNPETAQHFSKNLGRERQILFPKSANFSLHSTKLTSNPTLPPSKKSHRRAANCEISPFASEPTAQILGSTSYLYSYNVVIFLD